MLALARHQAQGARRLNSNSPKNISRELRTEIEVDLPQLWVDPIRVRQVLFDLLNNAARFTDQGSGR